MEYIIPAASAIVVAIIGRRPTDEDLYLCTCVSGGEEFEIYIVVLEKDQ